MKTKTKVEFTPAAIAVLRPENQQYERAEDSGLRVCVYPTGTKTYVVRYRFDSKPSKTTIGNAGSISLKDARAAAKKALGKVANGIDPNAADRAKRAEISNEVSKKFREFLDQHNTKRRGLPIRETTKVYTAALLGLKRNPKPNPKPDEKWVETGSGVLSHWKGKSLHTITEADVRDRLNEMSDQGAPIHANRTLAALKCFYRWAKIRPAPTDYIAQPNPETARNRKLLDDELRKVWLACDGEFYQMGAMVRLLILTGCRRDEVRCAKRTEFDLWAKEWTIPGERTKNGHEHIVPLSDLAMGVIASLPIIDGSDYLFTLDGKKPVCKPTRPFDRLCKRAKVFDWTLHDLRRTLVNGLQKIGVPVEVADAILNHRSGVVSGVTAVYATHDYDEEKRQALNAWAQHVREVIEAEPGEQVTFKNWRDEKWIETWVQRASVQPAKVTPFRRPQPQIA
jgi:integrase